jgi:hypothetical protein
VRQNSSGLDLTRSEQVLLCLDSEDPFASLWLCREKVMAELGLDKPSKDMSRIWKGGC